MEPDFEILCNTLGMTEIIRLQNMLSTALVRRFEKRMALAFSDIVGSTRYFSLFGNEAGRQLQQRHIDLLHQALAPSGGKIVDTAGDGAFLCFPSVDEATSAMIELLRLISSENITRAREHQIAIRIGIHYGPVLTDGQQVTGDPVNFCARVAGTANPGEIRLTKAAFFAFTDLQHRLKCRVIPPVAVKGVDQPIEMMTLDWRDRRVLPSYVRLETGEEFQLPDQDIISFGRLKDKDGLQANDIVLQCPDELQSLQISRWHFELRRRSEGYVLRAVSNAPTAVNGRTMVKGEELPVRPGDWVRIGDVLSIFFLAPQAEADQGKRAETIIASPRPSGPQALNAERVLSPDVKPAK